MQFLHSGFLWGLLALAIPVIIHLFSFRRFKTVYFSNVAFLKEIKEETSAKSKIKHWLILAARLLAILFLVLAFAQPFIAKKNTNVAAGQKAVSVFIDNSFSTNAQSNGVSLLDKQKQTALDILQNYAPNDRFQVLTHDFLGKHQRLVSKEEFKTLLDEIDYTASSQPLSTIVKRQSDALNLENSPNKIAYVLSDFQKNMGSFSPDTTIKYNLVPFTANEQNNIYIDSCWFYEPVQLKNQTNKLFIKIKNAGETNVENARLELKLNGQTKAITNFSVKENSYTIDTISFSIEKAGWNTAQLLIEDFPIVFDDNYYLSFNVLEKVKVMAISEAASNFYLDALFKNLKEVAYNSVNVSSINYNDISKQNFVILNNLSTVSSGLSASINSYLKEGGSLLILPNEKMDIVNINSFLKSINVDNYQPLKTEDIACENINLQSKLFRDVFEKVPTNLALPNLKKYFPITQVSGGESLLKLKNGSSLLAQYCYDNSMIYLSATSIATQGNELATSAIFAPMLYKMAIGNIQATATAHTIGSRSPIELNMNTISTNDKVYKLTSDKMEFIPEQQKLGNKLFLHLKNQLKKDGFYTLIGESNTAEQPKIAINYNRMESDLKFYSESDLAEKFTQANVQIYNNKSGNVGAVIKEKDQGISLWKVCIGLALFFLLVEILLLKFWDKISKKVGTN